MILTRNSSRLSKRKLCDRSSADDEVNPKRRKLEIKVEQPGEVHDKVRKVHVLVDRLNIPEGTKVPVKEENVQKEESDDEDSEDEDKGLCDFERRRLQNLKDNAAFLAKLGLPEAQKQLRLSFGCQKKKPTSRGLKEKRVNYELLPRRSSLRLKRIDPQGNYLPEPPPVTQTEIIEHPRVPAGPLKMNKHLRNSASEEDGEQFLTVLRDLSNGNKSEQSAETSTEVKRYIKSLSSMKITADQVAKLTPQRIFSVAVHPSEDKVLCAAGGKWGTLALWDVGSHAGQDGVYCYEPHSRPVSGCKFQPQQHGKLFSCSYDGTIRCAHFEQGVFDEIYTTPEEDDAWLCGFDFLSESSLIVAQGDCFLGVVDLRTPGASAEHLYPAHHRAVKCVDVHPTKKEYFVTASSDGNVCLWDLRKMSKKKANSLDVLAHSKSVDSAYFSPLTGKYILTTSMDDRIRIFDSSNLHGINRICSIRHFNHTGRWLSNFKAAWHPRREDIFVVGSMERPRRIEMFADSGQIVKKFQDGEHLGSVCSLNALHPTRNILMGGNSSGRVHVFM